MLGLSTSTMLVMVLPISIAFTARQLAAVSGASSALALLLSYALPMACAVLLLCAALPWRPEFWPPLAPTRWELRLVGLSGRRGSGGNRDGGAGADGCSNGDGSSVGSPGCDAHGPLWLLKLLAGAAVCLRVVEARLAALERELVAHLPRYVHPQLALLLVCAPCAFCTLAHCLFKLCFWGNSHPDASIHPIQVSLAQGRKLT